MKTAVVILNYNGKKHLESFLPSVVEFSQEAIVYVADNSSTDDSVAYVNTNFPSVQLLCLDQNYGFAEGYNQALKKIIGFELLVLLNSDVEVSQNWLAPFIHAFESSPLLGAAQPKIKSFNQKTYFEYAGAAGGFIDHLGYPFCRGRIFDTLEQDTAQYDTESEIFWATGACFFIKSSLFQELGGFDSKFFAHMEEIDLCWRIHHKGYSIKYLPNSVVYHVGGGTLHKSNPKKTYLNFRNNLLMLVKNLPIDSLFKVIFIRLILDGISGVKFIVDGSFKDCFAIIKAHFAFYALIPYAFKQRQKNLGGIETIYSKSIIWQYFVKKNHLYSNLEK